MVAELKKSLFFQIWHAPITFITQKEEVRILTLWKKFQEVSKAMEIINFSKISLFEKYLFEFVVVMKMRNIKC